MPTRPFRADLSRRGALALGGGLALAACLPATGFAAAQATFIYNLQPHEIAPGIWVIYGVNEPITAKNGGAIANIIIIDSDDGAVIIDTGPSHRYGMELAALSKTLTGKPTARVYITHIHSDHSLGATAFDANTLWAGRGLREDLAARGNDITNAMYRVAGDWMRDTNVPVPSHVASDGVETIGQRKFHCLSLSGHTALDLVLYEETSGLLFTGDLVFLDRAPTTPDADLANWHRSLAKLGDIPHKLLIPGHGPVEAGQRGIEQTNRWLDLIDTSINAQFNRGQDMLDMMGTPLPDWTQSIAVSRYEYQRSVMDLLPKLELAQLPIVT